MRTQPRPLSPAASKLDPIKLQTIRANQKDKNTWDEKYKSSPLESERPICLNIR